MPQLVDTEIMTSVNEAFEQKTKNNDTSKLESKNSHSNVELSSSCDQTITSLHDDNWMFFADLKEKANTSSSSSSASSLISKYKDTFQIDSQNDCKHSNSPTNFLSDEDAVSRCLTNSSCHSERSIAHLNCLILCETSQKEKMETVKLSTTEVPKLEIHLPKKTEIGMEDIVTKKTEKFDDTKFISKINIRFNENSTKKYIMPKKENILENNSSIMRSKESIESMKKCTDGTVVNKIAYNFPKMKSISEEKPADKETQDSFWNLPKTNLHENNSSNLKPEPITRKCLNI